MRLLLAAALAALLAVITTTDRVACFDGCTEETQHQGPSTTTTSVCGLCHGWNGPLAVDLSAPLAQPVLRLAMAASQELPAYVAPIDHPPRLA